MGRISKTERVPRTRANNKWTEAAFWGWLRSGFRKMSLRWPARAAAIARVKRKAINGKPRQKWQYQCEECLHWFAREEVEADHTVPCGSLKSFSDASGFLERLFVESDGFLVLCGPCNKVKDEELSNRKTATDQESPSCES